MPDHLDQAARLAPGPRRHDRQSGGVGDDDELVVVNAHPHHRGGALRPLMDNSRRLRELTTELATLALQQVRADPTQPDP